MPTLIEQRNVKKPKLFLKLDDWIVCVTSGFWTMCRYCIPYEWRSAGLRPSYASFGLVITTTYSLSHRKRAYILRYWFMYDSSHMQYSFDNNCTVFRKFIDIAQCEGLGLMDCHKCESVYNNKWRGFQRKTLFYAWSAMGAKQLTILCDAFTSIEASISGLRSVLVQACANWSQRRNGGQSVLPQHAIDWPNRLANNARRRRSPRGLKAVMPAIERSA